MTRVCLVGAPEVNVQYELLSRETAREALSTYDLERPFENSLAVRTVSVGAAVSLCNDLQWYVVRFVDEVLVQEPSVDREEWLSRDLAEALRNGDVEPEETGEYLKIYGVEAIDSSDAAAADSAEERDAGDGEPAVDGGDRVGAERDDRLEDGEGPGGTESDRADADSSEGNERDPTVPDGRLVEPLYVRRTDGEVPEYDLRDVDRTLVVRLTEEEFSP